MQVKEIFQFKESVGNIDSKSHTKRGFNWMFYSGFLFFSTKFRKFCSNHAIFDQFIEYKEEISIKEVLETSVQRYIWVLEAWSSVGNNILDFLFFRPNLASSVQNQVILNRFVKFISEEDVIVVIRRGYRHFNLKKDFGNIVSKSYILLWIFYFFNQILQWIRTHESSQCYFLFRPKFASFDSSNLYEKYEKRMLLLYSAGIVVVVYTPFPYT